MGPRDITSDHQGIEERSIALHRAIVERIRRDPRLMEIARANLYRLEQRFLNAGETPPGWLLEWKAILQNLSLDELEAVLVSPGEEARRLRQSSPFSGILTPRERWEIYEAFSARAYYQGRQ